MNGGRPRPGPPRGRPSRPLSRWFAAMALLALATAVLERCRVPDAAGRETWTVRVVHDGDTVTCHDTAGRAHRIRLLGIDAPEITQPHGPEARSALERKVGHRRVAVEAHGYDRHGRLLGKLWALDRDVNLEMVAEGHAWAFGGFAPDPEFVEAESLARRERRGLWAAASPEEPSRWRAAHPHVP